MLNFITNRFYRLKIGTRTAISFFAVVFVSLFFSVAAILLLQYSKNIDVKISNSFNPVINAIRDYQYIIEESGKLSKDLSYQFDENKHLRLEKILTSLHKRSKITVIEICQEPGLSDIRKSIIDTDKDYVLVMELQKQIVALSKNLANYSNADKQKQLLQLGSEIESQINSIKYKLSENSLEAIKVFKALETQKYASYRTLTYLLMIMIAVIIIVSIISVYITSITIIKPIKEISTILSEVSEGKIIAFKSKVKRSDEIGLMISTTQKVVAGFKQKTLVANAIGKGNYNINVPLLSKDDKLGKALEQMRFNLYESKVKLENNLHELEEYAVSLEKKNKELDQFAYITSHDLKSPLRGINNLAEWILEDMGENISETSEKYFELLIGRVHRMEALINSILNYSRAGNTIERQENISSKEIVLSTLNTIKPSVESKIFFDKNLPEIKANKKDITTIFYVLIKNAIAHNTPKNLVVNITYVNNSDFYTFCISDNGKGISADFHEKIFTIFQTLESRDKVESVGAGLAIAKKIIESYGGKIWIESEKGFGSSFYFTWPKKINSNKLVQPIVKKPKVLKLS